MADDYDLNDLLIRGPVTKRKFTDVIFCIIFSLLILSFIIAGSYAGTKGDLNLVAMPVDRFGNLCGKKNLKSSAGNLIQDNAADLTNFS